MVQKKHKNYMELYIECEKNLKKRDYKNLYKLIQKKNKKMLLVLIYLL